MGCYVRRQVLFLALSLLIVFEVAICEEEEEPLTLEDHGGKVLSGQLNVGILWYGPIPRVQKKAILSFFRSLNAPVEGEGPLVSKWWDMVASYNAGNTPGGATRRLPVKVVNQVADPDFSVGKILIKVFMDQLVPKATGGKPNTVAVFVAVKGVSVQDMCTGSCSQHGRTETNQTYVALGDPEEECAECAWPFVASPGKVGEVLKPPHGNIGADVMVKLLAGGLAELVTNPYGDGFYATATGDHTMEATSTCADVFPKDKLLLDASTGAHYNAVGEKGKKFLLPPIWNPKTSSCWTPTSS